LTEKKTSLANSCLYFSLVDLLGYLHRAATDGEQPGEAFDVVQSTAAKNIYHALTSEISRSVLDKLRSGDEVVVSRLGAFLLCITSGKSGVRTCAKVARFSTDEIKLAADSVAAGAEESPTVTKEGLSCGVDFMRDDVSPLWCLVSESCATSYSLVRGQSSHGHLRLLADVLCSAPGDRLLTDLLMRAGISASDGAAGCRDFLERIVLPLADEFHSDESSRHVLDLLSAIYGRLEPGDRVSVAREVCGRAARNAICADFLSELVLSKATPDDVRCWLGGEEFGSFVTSLVRTVCQRHSAAAGSDEVESDPMVSDHRSMDDRHWKLLCACVTVDQESGMSSRTILPVSARLQRITGGYVVCGLLCARENEVTLVWLCVFSCLHSSFLSLSFILNCAFQRDILVIII